MAWHDQFWIFHSRQNIFTITGYVIVVFNNVELALCRKPDRRTII